MISHGSTFRRPFSDGKLVCLGVFALCIHVFFLFYIFFSACTPQYQFTWLDITVCFLEGQTDIPSCSFFYFFILFFSAWPIICVRDIIIRPSFRFRNILLSFFHCFSSSPKVINLTILCI